MDDVLVQLKQQPLSQEVSSLALECNWEHLLDEIDNLLKQLGFVSFTYGVIARSLDDTNIDFQRLRGDQFGELAGSLPQSVKDAYYRDVARHDTVWDVLPAIESPMIVTAVNGSSGFAEAFWRKQGVNSRTYVPLAGSNDRYWFHYFSLYHKLPVAEFESFFENVKEWLVPILVRYHNLLQATSEVESNPFLDKGILSQTCLQVIRLTAQGLAVKSIADKLALTEEGITYHITRAKRIFGARNKTHLIAMMYEIGLL